MSVATVLRPATLAGVPLASWMFALRVWIAVVVALYVAFWLQLEAPSSVGIAVLAVPTRGQALEKAGFRFLATVIGVAAAIALVGMFSQTRDLLLLGFAAWIGLCVCMAKLSDGNRAYAAVLSGYTVGIVAIEQIDAPHHVFESGVARGAAIVVGIAAIAVVNDLLATPDRHTGLAAQLADIQRRVCTYVKAVIRGEATESTLAVGLLQEIAALRSEITSLATESSSGVNRSAAARSATVELVAQIHAGRVLAALPVTDDAALRERLASALDQDGTSHLAQPSSTEPAGPAPGEGTVASASLNWAAHELLRRHQGVCDALWALKVGARPSHTWRTPLYRCYRFAAEEGARAALWIALAATCYVLAGWSATGTSLTLVAVIIGLGAISPDARGFTKIALIAGLLSAVLAGVLEFQILDGVTEFPLLALGLAPFVIGSAAMIALPNPTLSGLGRLILTFLLVILGPSNPQSYNPQDFLDVSLFVVTAAVLLLMAQALIQPVSDKRRRQWMLRSARRELGYLLLRRTGGYRPEEAMFRDATRIGQVARGSDIHHPQHRIIVEQALKLADQAAVIRLSDGNLTKLADGPLSGIANRAWKAVAAGDPQSIRDVAFDMHNAAGEDALALETSGALYGKPRHGEDCMTKTFSELTVGGVLLAPFVAYAVMALALFLVLQPLLRLVGFPRLFSHPSIAALSLYVTILGLLTVLF
jgi:uncharacterized membrane protein YccC